MSVRRLLEHGGSRRAGVERASQRHSSDRATLLRTWATGIAGVVPIAEATALKEWRLAGVIDALVIDPTGPLPAVEATISDGSGHALARWLGWTSLMGLGVGRGLIVEGPVYLDDDHCRVLVEPRYEIVLGPIHRLG